MKKATLIITILVLFFNISFLYGQKSSMKFGKINSDNLSIEVCPIDSNAHAYFIFDHGETSFEYMDTKIVSNESNHTRKGFQINFIRHFRIKILDNQAFDWANIEIPLYHSSSSKEEVTSIKAVTYNYDGKRVEKTKFKRSSAILEEKNINIDILKFAMPNVKEGSILEVKYTIKSDYIFNMQSWAFQKSIPVLQSDYETFVPEYFNYKQTIKGYFPVEIDEDSRSRSIIITYEQKAEGSSVQAYKTEDTFDYREYSKHYFAKNIPAFPNEPYLRSRYNYLSNVEFELSSTKFPNRPVNSYTQTWEEINHKLLINDDFGLQLKTSGFMQDDVEVLLNTGLEDQDLLMEAFEFIKKRFTWNNLSRVYVTKSLRNAYKEATGSSSDINLNLVLFLRELGFNAYPVLLSTRSNGMIHPAHASVSKFNYAIALVQLNGKDYLMDATDPLSEINTLPIRCLNDKGRIIDENIFGWISLRQNKTYKSQCMYKVSMDNEGVFSGNISYKYYDFAAYLKRKEIKSDGDIENYIDDLQKYNEGLIVNNYSVTNLDTLNKSLSESIDVKIEGRVESAGDIIYFSPLLFESWTDNPFKLEKRDYPIEYDYPLTLNHIIVIEIPENFKVESLPGSQIFTLPDKSFKYSYKVVALGNKIQVTSLLARKNDFYLPDDYANLKAFYDMVIAKQKEQIVLKMN